MALFTAHRRRHVAPGWQVCPHCGEVFDSRAGWEMRRPGRSKGVVWCEACAAPYLEG